MASHPFTAALPAAIRALSLLDMQKLPPECCCCHARRRLSERQRDRAARQAIAFQTPARPLTGKALLHASLGTAAYGGYAHASYHTASDTFVRDGSCAM